MAELICFIFAIFQASGNIPAVIVLVTEFMFQ